MGCNTIDMFKRAEISAIEENTFALGTYTKFGVDDNGVPTFVHDLDTALGLNDGSGVFIEKVFLYFIPGTPSGEWMIGDAVNAVTVFWKAQEYNAADDGSSDDPTSYLWPTEVKGDWRVQNSAGQFQADESAGMRCVSSDSDDEVISDLELPYFIVACILICIGLSFAAAAIFGAWKKSRSSSGMRQESGEGGGGGEEGGAGSGFGIEEAYQQEGISKKKEERAAKKAAYKAGLKAYKNATPEQRRAFAGAAKRGTAAASKN